MSQNQQNGHSQQHLSQQQRQQSQQQRSPVTVVGIPSVSIENNRLVVGDASTSSTRSYTTIKCLGDGSFGTVWLCDWHGALPPNTPLSPMQCGAGARPEWAGKRLVAVKLMRRRWEGGWDECQKLKELQSLRTIPFHPNIIPLYDFFLLPDTKQLYFVFESMEGNLYHLIKARKGRALAGGLVCDIFRQIVSGLDHIHTAGYFHRDMKPENVLVTTIGLHDYVSVSPVAPPNAPREKDVIAIIKLADFGLARETKSQPPYTEYVSTRWYRAPEVLLLSRNYSNPVDMWALGTIMAELVNLKPLFPGSDHLDQISRITEILGDPCDDYRDIHQNPIGGGGWSKGIELAAQVGFQFTKTQPQDIHSLFERTVPTSLIHCIRDLLRYDPDKRLTSRQCLRHPYLLDVYPRNNIPTSEEIQKERPKQRPNDHPPNGYRQPHPALTRPPIPGAPPAQRAHYHHNLAIPQHHLHHPNGSPHHDEFTPIPPLQSYGRPTPQAVSKSSKFNFIKPSKWFGEKSNHLPPVEEVPGLPKVLGRKRTQSSSTDKSVRASTPPENDPRKSKKEAERLQREAEKKRRELAERSNREQARAVMQKRIQMMQKTALGAELEWQSANEQRVEVLKDKGKQSSTGPIRKPSNSNVNLGGLTSTTINAAAGRFGAHNDSLMVGTDRDRDWRKTSERIPKARRRDFDDDHSMSSSDVHSLSRVSSMSFVSVDSDPGPSRARLRPNMFTMSRMASLSSLRTFDDYPTTARSSNSFSLEGQLVHDFRTQANMNSNTPVESVSPPPMQTLSLSPTLSPSLSPSPPWIPPIQQHKDYQMAQHDHRPYEFPVTVQPPSSYGHPTSPYGHKPTSGNTPKSSKSAINPIFKVVSYKWDRSGGLVPDDDLGDSNQPPLPPSTGHHSLHLSSSPNKLPPFSQLDAVAGGEYPPLSPMSFGSPSEETSSSST